MQLERIRAYLTLNLIEHKAGVNLVPFFEAGYDVEEVVQFPRLKWEEYYSKVSVDKVFTQRKNLRIEQELEFIIQNKIGLLPFEDSDYPPLLRDIYNPPRLLYFLGKLAPSDAMHIAIVGSRDCSLAGKCLAEEAGAFLARHGISVVSGFARGIDRAGHTGVVNTNPQGFAVGVVASGIGEYLKPKLLDLYERVMQNGLIVTEFPVASNATKRNFPMRNRIITGMSVATIIVEARIRSGSMVSARLALEQGREVFAVPGPMHSELSAGPNSLIRTGANLVSCWEDVLEDLKLPITSKQDSQLPEEDQRFLDYVKSVPTSLDDILYKSQKPLNWVLKKIVELESKGYLRRHPGDKVSKTS